MQGLAGARGRLMRSSRSSAASKPLQLLADQEHAHCDEEKAEHLAKRDPLVELGHDSQRWNTEPDELQKSSQRVHTQHGTIEAVSQQVRRP